MGHGVGNWCEDTDTVQQPRLTAARFRSRVVPRVRLLSVWVIFDGFGGLCSRQEQGAVPQ